ncbi:MAG: radical SAM-associated putative lipoprotein [Tannerella sp.]|jgi:putative lipoprotein (rSAM/lipoprotein system)|nr:radical SAM-associated putative lipoprotein [Tannerella sp.]
MVRKMNRSLIRGINWILTGLLSMLGFSGCSDKDGVTPEYGVMMEYGTPYATFLFQGKVTDKAGKPVQDIKVEVSRDDRPVANPTITNAYGQYFAEFKFFPHKDFQVIASDIDGEANGSYRNDTIRVEIAETDYYEQGEGWNKGSAAKEINIVLKEKE